MKKKYNKPIIQITEVRNEMNFCSSIYENRSVNAKGHEVGGDYEFNVDGSGANKNGSTASDGEFSITWE